MLPDILAELSKRSKFNEGVRLYKYLDSVGVPTLGRGYNLQNNNAHTIFDQVGIDYARVMAAPTAKDSEPENAVAECITLAQADALFDLILPTYIGQARALLPQGVFDSLTGARQCAWSDMTYNMGNGEDGLGGFRNSISLLINAQRLKMAGKGPEAHETFVKLGAALAQSAWYRQVGDRAKRNVAMLVAGVYCRIDGDGTDIQ